MNSNCVYSHASLLGHESLWKVPEIANLETEKAIAFLA